MRLLVTGVGGPAGIEVVRSLLGYDGVTVFGCDCDKNAPGFFLLGTNYWISPEYDDMILVDSYEAVIHKFGIDKILPTVEDETLVLKGSRLSSVTVASPLSALKICKRKDSTYTALDGEVPVPRWFNLDGIDSIGDDELYVRPVSGRGNRHGYKIELDHLNVFRSLFVSLRLEGIVCEYLPGIEVSADCLGFNGIMQLCVLRSRDRVIGSTAVVGSTMHDDTLVKYCYKIYKLLNLHGPASIQFKRGKDGVFKLLEVNPRFGGGLGLTRLLGIDMPRLLVDSLLGKATINISELKSGRACCYSGIDEVRNV